MVGSDPSIHKLHSVVGKSLDNFISTQWNVLFVECYYGIQVDEVQLIVGFVGTIMILTAIEITFILHVFSL